MDVGKSLHPCAHNVEREVQSILHFVVNADFLYNSLNLIILMIGVDTFVTMLSNSVIIFLTIRK